MLRNYVVLNEIRRNKVYLIQYQDGLKCYLKKYQAQQYPNIFEVLEALQETKSKNIVKIYNFWVENNELIYVVEEACKFNLREFMKNNQEKFDILDILKCLLDIIEGLLELKNLQVFHRDIKPENIVYDGNNYKIIDFETAKKFQDDRIKIQSYDIGTQGYHAPEISQKQSYSSKCDVWSLGCLFYFILFKHDRNEKYIPQKHNYDDNIIKMLNRMLEADQTKRITLDVLKQEALKLYNFYDNASQSTSLEQNIEFDDVEKFNKIMTELIKQEQNQQKIIYLYQFWVKRLENKFSQDQNLRLKINNQLLVQIMQFQKRKIKINLFATIDQIKNELKGIKELKEFNDF